LHAHALHHPVCLAGIDLSTTHHNEIKSFPPVR
jgi:hypothetical protein